MRRRNPDYDTHARHAEELWDRYRAARNEFFRDWDNDDAPINYDALLRAFTHLTELRLEMRSLGNYAVGTTERGTGHTLRDIDTRYQKWVKYMKEALASDDVFPEPPGISQYQEIQSARRERRASAVQRRPGVAFVTPQVEQVKAELRALKVAARQHSLAGDHDGAQELLTLMAEQMVEHDLEEGDF